MYRHIRHTKRIKTTMAKWKTQTVPGILEDLGSAFNFKYRHNQQHVFSRNVLLFMKDLAISMRATEGSIQQLSNFRDFSLKTQNRSRKVKNQTKFLKTTVYSKKSRFRIVKGRVCYWSFNHSLCAKTEKFYIFLACLKRIHLPDFRQKNFKTHWPASFFFRITSFFT